MRAATLLVSRIEQTPNLALAEAAAARHTAGLRFMSIATSLAPASLFPLASDLCLPQLHVLYKIHSPPLFTEVLRMVLRVQTQRLVTGS
jgi:hypothetical protein